MKPLEERNLIWNLLEVLIEKYQLKNKTEFLDPRAEDEIVFGNFVEGHPMSFEGDFKEMVTELTRLLPGEYDVALSYLFDDASGCIGIVKI